MGRELNTEVITFTELNDAVKAAAVWIAQNKNVIQVHNIQIFKPNLFWMIHIFYFNQPGSSGQLDEVNDEFRDHNPDQ